ncbi:MAG: stage II sporulation protein M [bacterium]|nr:stage II sporulation protein M [bacterium]
MKKLSIFTSKLGVRQILLICLLFGVGLGTIFANISKEFYLDRLFLFNDSFTKTFETMDLDKFMITQMAFVDYIKEFGLLILLSTTILGKPYIFIHCTYKGFTLGFILSTAVMRYGLKGILFFICYISPQYLIYLPLLVWTYLKGYEVNCKLVGRREGDHFRIKSYVPNLFFLLIMIILISLLEGYVNTSLLHMIMLKLMS